MFDFPTTPARSATRRWTALASVGLHAVVLVAVVTHPQAAPAPDVEPPPDTHVFRLDPVQPAQIDQPLHRDPVESAGPAPVLDFPNAILDGIPPPDLSAAPLDPRTLTGAASTSPLDSLMTGTGPAISSGAPLDWRTVDEPPRLLSAGAPDYPPSLKGMGLEGAVRLRFVVDTNGRAMPETIEVISSTHPLFISAAKKTVTESRFEPGRVNGRAVKVMVEQVIEYRE